MSLTFDESSEEFEPLGAWPLPPEPPFMRGEVYSALRQDIERYVAGNIAGRSYLIAGHRGSGKTALTVAAVRELRRSLLRNYIRSDRSVLWSSSKRVQRPLLVKLHGPSLTETESASSFSDAATAASAGAPEINAHAALKQITIALYRALASETAQAARWHAEEKAVGHSGEKREIAAQLALDLDAGLEPGPLRTYWDRLDRLGRGLLWPRRAEEMLREREPSDQGLREILALATAAQAYRVCIGAVTFEQSKKDDHSGSTEIKQSQSWDIKSLTGLVGVLGAGVLTAGAVWGKAPWTSIGAGALVWLAGGLAISWSHQRRHDRQHGASYSFIRDSSLQTLDRELPLVVERIREAGLAPIFVIDELDKLATANVGIAQIISRLKHIIADYGFFCFLTDRDYYDHVQDRLEKDPFPVEHTFFSEMRLVSYRPTELAEYIGDRLKSDQADPGELLERQIFTYWILHQAKLNFTDVHRQLRAHIGDEGVLKLQSAQLRGRVDIALKVSIQLAIEEVLKTPDLQVRMDSDQAFAQLTIDALYAVSRGWEAFDKEYDADPAKLRTYLDKRMKAASDAKLLSDSTLTSLDGAVTTLIGYLKDFGALARAVAARPGLADMASFIPRTAPGLLAQRSGKSRKHPFLFDPHGGRIGDTGPLDDAEMVELLDLMTALESLFSTLGISFEDLIEARLLPPGQSWEALREAWRRLLAWQQDRDDEAATRTALAALRTLRATLHDFGHRLTAGLMLAEHLAYEAQKGLPDGLATLKRYPVFGPTVEIWTWRYDEWRKTVKGFPALNLGTEIRGDHDAILHFLESFRQVSDQPNRRRRTSVRIPQVQQLWLKRLESHFKLATATATPFAGGELVAAARDTAPYRWFRADLELLTIEEWSAIALWALPQYADAPQRWFLVAALRALGFESRVLTEVATQPDPGGDAPSNVERNLGLGLAQGGGKAGRGHLIIALDSPTGVEFSPARAGPYLLVRRSAFSQYELGLLWLVRLNAFAGVIDEVEIEDQ